MIREAIFERKEKIEERTYEQLKTWANKILDKMKIGVQKIQSSASRIRINWLSILVIIILANMAQKGMLDEMPNIKWLVESAVRGFDWLMGLFRELMKWLVEFPYFNILDDFFKNIFAL